MFEEVTELVAERDHYKVMFERYEKLVTEYQNENVRLWNEISKFKGGLEVARNRPNN